MTLFGYDMKISRELEESCVRFAVSPNLLELFSETNIEKLPIKLVEPPYPIMLIETHDKITPRVEIAAILLMCNPESKFSEEMSFGDGLNRREYAAGEKWYESCNMMLAPFYKVDGRLWIPVRFAIRPTDGTVDAVTVDWSTHAKSAEEIGLHEEHPLVKRASLYCWIIAAMTCIYVTCNDADIILGIKTKEYAKIKKKKRARTSKLKQLENTRYLGRDIKIDRKLLNRKTPSKGGTHTSPIPHWRTGHFRNLGDGRMVWIRPTIVGFGKEKRIPALKKYLMK